MTFTVKSMTDRLLRLIQICMDGEQLWVGATQSAMIYAVQKGSLTDCLARVVCHHTGEAMGIESLAFG